MFKENVVLSSNDKLTKLAKSYNISQWNELTSFVKNLPYGRNKTRNDLSLVLQQQKGTCSSKHALLKAIADLNTIPDVKLILGMYKMNHINTPKIGNVLIKNNIEFIPEAHCYLLINNERLDFTTSSSDFGRLKDAILFEKEIQPHQVAEFKVNFHKNYMKRWIIDNNIHFTFNELWLLREQCIENLSA
ncbi:hypothetical protein [Winogradskyella sp. UBA3174]|uniref:hypothetical protein n=1 Tax=Winogradskyella sp. UBA3174 TaxID=1947785 RepID=UPI0025FBEAC0|nr:hypothetical protein [Winogradskyella sp. UBA3174]|tara:strand:- start:8224 stop:8790 length:567 start_codon:yes stop_codon:yes gene_type:complete